MKSRLSGLQDSAKPRLIWVGGPAQPEWTVCLYFLLSGKSEKKQ
jgi:hypothetical protein